MVYQFFQIINAEEINFLMDRLYKLTGILLYITDINGQSFDNKEGKNIFVKYYKQHSKVIKVPIVINGIQLATLSTEEFFSQKPDLKYFEIQAQKYGFDKEEYIRTINEIPVLSEKDEQTMIKSVFKLGEILSFIGSNKLRQLEMIENIRYLAYYDSLTNIPNRFYFITKFNEKFNKIKDSDDFKCALFFIDIYDFKEINDTYGYEFGDNLLKKVASLLQGKLQEQEILSRIAGDEFAFTMFNYKNIEELKLKAEDLIGSFDNLIEIDNYKIFVTISVGVALYPEDGTDVNKIIQSADIAMQNARKSGKGKYSFLDESTKNEIILKMKTEAELARAIRNKDEFILYFQPQINSSTSEVYGMEALLRWKHPERGILSPASFIDIVEQNGMINEIGRFILHEACTQISRWHNLGYGKLTMSINVSEKQLEDSSFLGFVNEVLKETNIDTRYLCIEITESILLNPTKKILDILLKLKELGIKIFIDDFGTKYSSLNYLRRLPIDGIKIDKSFIDEICSSEKELIITKNIINLAQELKLEVVAEGVENKEQLSCLKNINCNKIQGFIYGKPMSSKDFCDYWSLRLKQS